MTETRIGSGRLALRGTRKDLRFAAAVAAFLALPALAQDRPTPAPGKAETAAQGTTMAGITNLTVATGERPAPPRPPAPQYVDRLIEGVAPDDEAAEPAQAGDLEPGLRHWSTEFFMDHREISGLGTTNSPGIALRHRRETERYGDFQLELDVSRGEQMPSDPRLTRARFTLFHDQFALTDSVSANTVFGTWRSAFSPWLASSYRVNLSSSLAAGAFTIVSGPNSELRAGGGRIGKLVGMSVQGFEALEGTVANVDYSRRLGNGSFVGGGLVSVRGSRDVPDHTAATIAADMPVSSPVGDGRMKFQAAVDDNGETGFWADGQLKSGRVTHRLGAFRMSPALLFGEITPQKDSQGLYWRTDTRSSAMSANFGIDLSSTNLDRDASRGGSDAAEGYGNLSLRLDRSTSVGAGLGLRDDHARTATGVTSRRASASAWISRLTPWGNSRLDATFTRTAFEASTDSSRYYAWSHEWPSLGGLASPNTLISFTEERLDGRRVRRTSANLGLRGELAGPLSWNATITGVDVDDGDASERNYNASVSLDWQASSEWVLRLQWQRNEIQPALTNAAAPFTRDNTVMLSARYDAVAGTPYPRIAAVGGRSGTGTITGTLFFDENRDGVRQATERGASGITVLLDGRQMQTTDAEGRFTFRLVAPGEHRLGVAVDRIPLPWGLEDEAPARVRVQVREDTRIDIGLTRVAP